SQYDNDSGTGEVSQNFESANDAYDSQAADDFVVPSGQVWHVAEVDVLGTYFNGNGPAASFNVWIYTDASGVPGSQVYQALNAAYSSGDSFNYVIPLSTPATVVAGHYFVSVQANMDFTPNGQW